MTDVTSAVCMTQESKLYKHSLTWKRDKSKVCVIGASGEHFGFTWRVMEYQWQALATNHLPHKADSEVLSPLLYLDHRNSRIDSRKLLWRWQTPTVCKIRNFIRAAKNIDLFNYKRLQKPMTNFVFLCKYVQIRWKQVYIPDHPRDQKLLCELPIH